MHQPVLELIEEPALAVADSQRTKRLTWHEIGLKCWSSLLRAGGWLLKKAFRVVWWSLSLGRIGGVPLRVHSTFLFFICVFVLWGGWKAGGFLGSAIGLAFVLSACACVMGHEFAHIAAARAWGCNAESVLVTPFGCVAFLENIPRELGELCVALAGPAASAALALLFWLAQLACPDLDDYAPWSLHQIFGLAWSYNLLIACFNLLPCFPMDGGRVLRAGLAMVIRFAFQRDHDSAHLLATRIAVRYVGRAIVVGIVIATIGWTHCWPHLVLFPLLALAGEAEYYVLANPSDSEEGLIEKNEPTHL